MQITWKLRMARFRRNATFRRQRPPVDRDLIGSGPRRRWRWRSDAAGSPLQLWCLCGAQVLPELFAKTVCALQELVALFRRDG
jgi:hypothetical protein